MATKRNKQTTTVAKPKTTDTSDTSTDNQNETAVDKSDAAKETKPETTTEQTTTESSGSETKAPTEEPEATTGSAKESEEPETPAEETPVEEAPTEDAAKPSEAPESNQEAHTDPTGTDAETQVEEGPQPTKGTETPTETDAPTETESTNSTDKPLPGAPVNYSEKDWLGEVRTTTLGYPEIQIAQSDRHYQRLIKKDINQLCAILHPKAPAHLTEENMVKSSRLLLGIYRNAMSAGPRKEDDQLGDNYINCMNILMGAMAHPEIGKSFNKRYIYCEDSKGFPYETLTTLLLRVCEENKTMRKWQTALRSKRFAPTVTVITEQCSKDARSLSGKLRAWFDVFAQ